MCLLLMLSQSTFVVLSIASVGPSDDGKLEGDDFDTWNTDQVDSGQRCLALAEGSYHVSPGRNHMAHIQL